MQFGFDLTIGESTFCDMMNDLINIRRRLHQHPELSNYEEKTAKLVFELLEKLCPDDLFSQIAGHGILAVFDSKKPGPSIMFRAELDALPIQEKNSHDYVSKVDFVSHVCGHDGHMSILLGLAQHLQDRNSFCGKVLLLFQPAEEMSQGAERVVADRIFKEHVPDYLFALHNIPKYPLGSILIKDDVFALSSVGLIVKLHGVSSHAGKPEDGNNPVFCMIKILESLAQLSASMKSDLHRSFITIIHARLGEVAFGTNPGEAEIMATFRSSKDSVMTTMKKTAEDFVKKHSKDFALSYDLEWVEYFPATVNSSACVELIRKVSNKQKRRIIELTEAFAWSEDFSYYGPHCKCGYFGVGSGVDSAQLHNPDFDFPEELLPVGIEMFVGLIEEICLLEEEK